MRGPPEPPLTFYDLRCAVRDWLIIIASVCVIITCIVFAVVGIPTVNDVRTAAKSVNTAAQLGAQLLDPSSSSARNARSLEEEFTLFNLAHKTFDVLNTIQEYQMIENFSDLLPYAYTVATHNYTKPALEAFAQATRKVGAMIEDGRVEHAIVWMGDRYDSLTEFARSHGADEVAEAMVALKPQAERAFNETAHFMEVALRGMGSPEATHVFDMVYVGYERLTEGDRWGRIIDTIPGIFDNLRIFFNRMKESSLLDIIESLPHAFSNAEEKASVGGKVILGGIEGALKFLPHEKSVESNRDSEGGRRAPR